MTTLRSSRRPMVLVLAALLAGTGSSACGSSDGEAEDALRSGTVEMRVDLPEGSRWEMTGPLVDAGAVCARGYNRNVAMLDPTTRERLSAAEFMRRVDQRSVPNEGVDVIMVEEKRCADGSGSFVIEIWPAGDECRVLSGTGAYRSMRGEGMARGGMDLVGNPDWLHVELELDLDAAAEEPAAPPSSP